MAIARILMGFVLLGDLFTRWRFCREFYTSEGFCSRALVLESLANYLLPSLHLANDTEAYQSLLFTLGMVFAGGLLLGYRTRLCSLLSWLLLVSLHERNFLVLNSGDTLLAALLFWGIFLPWGATWSVDSRKAGAPEVRERLVLSAATIGWSLQMSYLYLFAALHKLHPYWLSEGSALYYALNIGHHATSWANSLLTYPEALRVLTRAVWGTELLLAFAVLAPWRRLRLVAIVVAVLMHLSFGLFLEIGVFRYVPVIGLLALLPRFSSGLPRDQLRVELPAGRSALLLGVCLLNLAVNFESLGKGKQVFVPPSILRVASLFAGLQNFGVFAGPGLEQDGWFAIQVHARDGKDYDAWRGDRPWDSNRPELVSATFPDDRWRKYLMNLPGLPQESPYRRGFAEWAKGEWNSRHPMNQATAVRVWQAVVRTSPSGGASEPEWILVAEVRR